LTPFASPLGLRIPTTEEVGSVKQNEEERKGATANDKVILGMFKHTEEEKKNDFVIPLDVDELENSVADDVQQSRKRKNHLKVCLLIPVDLSPGFLKLIAFYFLD
jgi:hypothetical protein